MMIGEIEFDAIFNDAENKVYFTGPAYILFILFLLFMSIIIMNMLIGLAVDDIKGVQEKATLKRLAMKVCMIAFCANNFLFMMNKKVFILTLL